jgi:hypothetical protein
MSINPSTNDIIEDIRKKLKIAQEKLNANEEERGDEVDLSSEDKILPIVEDESYDEVILSNENRAEVQKKQETQNLDDIKNTILDDFEDDNNNEHESNKEQDDEEIEEYQEEDIQEQLDDFEDDNNNEDESNKEQDDEEIEKYQEEDIQEQLDDFEDDNNNEDESNKEQDDEEIEEYQEEDIQEEDYRREYDEKDYSNQTPQFNNMTNVLTDKIAEILDAKLSNFVKAQKKEDEKISDLVRAELPKILINWMQNNQELIINIIESVVEKQISEAISKIKK